MYTKEREHDGMQYECNGIEAKPNLRTKQEAMEMCNFDQTCTGFWDICETGMFTVCFGTIEPHRRNRCNNDKASIKYIKGTCNRLSKLRSRRNKFLGEMIL